MARLTRQVGIRSAEVRLPGPSSAGPAIVKTAMSAVNQQFEKQADLRDQEAMQAAAKLNFERDGDGNLVSPSLPLTEDGLLAPSIYDRKYTQMVSQRYVNQIKIDTSKQLNTIATEHWDDPFAFQQVAESYVKKVTELAPDRIKPDVNMTAQAKMVEHFNHITRVKAERDHTEAKGVHIQAMQDDIEELSGYIRSGADPELIAAAKNRYLAKVLEGGFEGEGFNFFTEDEAAQYMAIADKAVAFNSLLRDINNIPNDEVAYADAILQMESFAMGEGQIEIPNELGELVKRDVADVFDPTEIQEVANAAKSLLAQRATSFTNYKDSRLDRAKEKFYNWYSPHALASVTPGMGVELDIPRLFQEFEKAHFDVVNKGYDKSLREEIRAILTASLGQNTGSMSKEEQDFYADLQSYLRDYENERVQRTGEIDTSDVNEDEALQLDYDIVNSIGNLGSGVKQTAGNSRFIGKYYDRMTGMEMNQDFINDLIQNPNDEELWRRVDFEISSRLSKFGIIPVEWSNAIVGKLSDPEGMNQETLNAVLRFGRMLYDSPAFRNNMDDGNAMGRAGLALRHIFKMGGQPTPAEVAKHLENFSNPDYVPGRRFENMDPDTQEMFHASAEKAIDRLYNTGWRTAWTKVGVQTGSGFDSPFDKDLMGVPPDVKDEVIERVKGQSGFIDPDDPEQFMPFVSRIASDVMNDLGYIPSSIGYDPARYSGDYFAEWTRPDKAIVQFPPEYFARTGRNQTVDQALVDRFTENLQIVLEAYDRQQNGGFLSDGSANPDWKPTWIAGLNAGVEYNGDATKRNGTPTWNIVVPRQDGMHPYLTDESSVGGDLVTIDMTEVFDWDKKRKASQKELRDSVNAAGKNRLRYQEMGGPIGPMSPL